MFVVPFPIGADELFIDKAEGRLPMGDDAAPYERDAVESEAIVESNALTHFDGERRHDMKVKPGGSDPFQIERVAVEGEEFFRREWDRLFAFNQEMAREGGMRNDPELICIGCAW